MLLLLLPFALCSFVQFVLEILEKCLVCLGYRQRHWENRRKKGPLPLESLHSVCADTWLVIPSITGLALVYVVPVQVILDVL